MDAEGSMWVTLGIVAALVLGVAGLMRLSSSGPRPFYGGRVTGVVGRMGSGKTLFVVWTLQRRLLAGGTVAANFTLDVPGAKGTILRIRSWEDLAALPPRTLAVVDEAHLWAPATAGRSIPAEVRWLLSHLRKLEIELWWITQHEDRVAAAVRQQTHEMVRCKRRGAGRRGVHVAEWFTPESLRSKDVKPLWRIRYRPTKRLISTYATHEMIAADDMAEAAETIKRWLSARVRSGDRLSLPCDPGERETDTVPRTARGSAWQPTPSANRSVSYTEVHNGVDGSTSH